MIYFISCPDADAVKIGFASKASWACDDLASAFARLGRAQVDCPFELELLAVCAGDQIDERELHEQFAADCIRGEWYRATPELKAHIAQFTKPQKRARRYAGYPAHEVVNF